MTHFGQLSNLTFSMLVDDSSKALCVHDCTWGGRYSCLTGGRVSYCTHYSTPTAVPKEMEELARSSHGTYTCRVMAGQ